MELIELHRLDLSACFQFIEAVFEVEAHLNQFAATHCTLVHHPQIFALHRRHIELQQRLAIFDVFAGTFINLQNAAADRRRDNLFGQRRQLASCVDRDLDRAPIGEADRQAFRRNGFVQPNVDQHDGRDEAAGDDRQPNDVFAPACFFDLFGYLSVHSCNCVINRDAKHITH